MRINTLAAACTLAALAGCASTGPAATGVRPAVPGQAKNVIFFLGDGMGINTLTAARIYAVGEEGELAIDTLPESAFVKTFSNDAQVTDSAASMSAYMTGVKQNNGVISMSSDTRSIAPATEGNRSVSRCANGSAVPTLAELAKARGMAAGVVTTTSVTDATPAATYAHACHRKLEQDIAAALVPGGAGYNKALGSAGLDLVFGGGAQQFTPLDAGGKRADGRNLLGELQAKGWRVAANTAQLQALAPNGQPAIGLFAPNHFKYEAARDPAQQPALAEMTSKAIDILANNPNGFFLMVEGGLIDHALHATVAKRALQETVAYNAAIQTALDKMNKLDPGLKNTLIVATADHDHTLLINGYSPRTGKTTPTNAGVLGLVRSLPDGKVRLDKDGAPFTILGFGAGEHRIQGSRKDVKLSDAIAAGDDYHQEAVVRTRTGAGIHGGADVYLGAAGANAELFRGTIDNTRVFDLIKSAAGL
ncbi:MULTISPECIES: alkaline phosphatase [unclassified Massilia]|uniref:alkaline phosphatase n=1 Tax=unclassified Massilia TaxID=2609279 RepID=UPI001781F9B5|nr:MULTISPECIES: alkaline phosphatase [unclassified Massilia]MBD8530809.1 alkaline phosphatase [Massilia sp. CFBP 13647]MBD8674508.1 alkaline phosphatase [Massilia sp. CFBP 13721]